MKALRQRLTSGWNLSRVLFVLAGGFLTAEAIVSGSRIGLFPGIYFLLSGSWPSGCAGGNCAVPQNRRKF